MRVLLLFLTIFCITILGQTSDEEVVPIKQLIPDIVLDLRYNTINNFCHQKLYTTDEAYLSIGAIKRLIVIQDSLRKILSYNGVSYPQGLGLLIYDGYRPRSVQYLMWEFFQAPYVADPNVGSIHNRGGAVDVSIVNLATVQPLQMPTDFDFFGPQASHSYMNLPANVIANRTLLYNMMVYVGGFNPYDVEWWHYTYPPSSNYQLLDFQMK